MNIEKYIGLFLEKNRYCYLPNLGEFLIVKKPSQIDGNEVSAPEFAVNFKFSGGLIDDSLANFIAVSERTSIANSANAIREFSVETRKILSEGGTVEIPGFGKFLSNNGKNEFLPDPNIKLAPPMSIPNFKNVSQTGTGAGAIEVNSAPSIAEMHKKMDLRAPSSQDEIVIKPPTVNWGKIIALAVIALAILGLIGGGIWYMNHNKTEEVVPAVAEPAKPLPASDTAIIAANPTDSMNGQNSAAVASTATSGSVFGILNFADKASASKKEAQLKSYGHNVAVLDNADGTFTLTLTLPEVVNAEGAKDSLRRFFNPKGSVTVIK